MGRSLRCKKYKEKNHDDRGKSYSIGGSGRNNKTQIKIWLLLQLQRSLVNVLSYISVSSILYKRNQYIVFHVRKIPTKKKGNALFYFCCQSVNIGDIETCLLEFEVHDKKNAKQKEYCV